MTATRRLYLPIIGDDGVVDVPVPGGETTVTGALPAARAVSRHVMAHSISELPLGAEVSCKAGCSACCSHLILISVVEARAIQVAIDRMPAPARKRTKAKFAAALERLEGAGWLGPKSDNTARRALAYASTATDPAGKWLEFNRAYIKLEIPCPLLEQDRCTIYADRPFVCREYLAVSDPVHCETVAEEMQLVPRPLSTSLSLTELASEIEGQPYKAVPLPLALEWLAHNPAPDIKVDGAELIEQWWVRFEAHWDESA